MNILGMGLFFGLYSEGFDRLWIKHLLGRFTLPVFFGSNDIAFFGLLDALSVLLSIAAVALVEKWLDTSASRLGCARRCAGGYPPAGQVR